MSKAITLMDCEHAAHELALNIGINKRISSNNAVYGIPRGGIVPAYMFANAIGGYVTEDIRKANFIIDDLANSGATLERVGANLPKQPSDPVPIFGVLFSKQRIPGWVYGTLCDSEEWLTFPWEIGDKDYSKTDSVVRMLEAIGEDPTRAGLLDTPRRVIEAWAEWFAGYGVDPKSLVKLFDDGAEKADEMVVLRNIPIMSHCEHHMCPFIGTANIAYVPNGKIIGLSKIPRLVDVFARRLQVQERLTNQIADALVEYMDPLGVGVTITAQHFCMTTRGVKTPGVDTVTSAVRGCIKERPEARAEFLALCVK